MLCLVFSVFLLSCSSLLYDNRGVNNSSRNVICVCEFCRIPLQDTNTPLSTDVQCVDHIFTSSVVGRRVLVLSSGWLASYVGQSEVPALITSLLLCLPPADAFVFSTSFLVFFPSHHCGTAVLSSFAFIPSESTKLRKVLQLIDIIHIICLTHYGVIFVQCLRPLRCMHYQPTVLLVHLCAFIQCLHVMTLTFFAFHHPLFHVYPTDIGLHQMLLCVCGHSVPVHT